MYTENLPDDYQPENRSLAPSVDSRTRQRWTKFLDQVEDGVPVNIIMKNLGVSGYTYCEWLAYPEFKYKIDRIRELRKEVLDDTVYAVGLNPRHGAEDRRLWLKAHHPAYQETKTPQVAVQINIDTTALKKSRDIHKQVNVKDTTTE